MSKLSMRLIQKWEKRRLKAKYYYRGIKRFLEDDEKFKSISHVIFGHSHKALKTEKNINDKQVIIVNDGVWQHIKIPSFVEIGLNGEINLREFVA